MSPPKQVSEDMQLNHCLAEAKQVWVCLFSGWETHWLSYKCHLDFYEGTGAE